MTNQQIFETLADNEKKLFYALCQNKENETFFMFVYILEGIYI